MKGTVADAVASAVQQMAAKMDGGELKVSVADFARLLDLQRELIADDIRQIKVTWVDLSSETESITEE